SERRDVGGAPHAQHAANGQRRFRIDAHEARVGVRAAHDAEVDKLRPREIVDVAAVTAEVTDGVLALWRLADHEGLRRTRSVSLAASMGFPLLCPTWYRERPLSTRRTR